MKSWKLWTISMMCLALLTGGCMSKEEKTPPQDDLELVTERLHQTFYEFNIHGGTLNIPFDVENFGLNGFYSLTRSQTGGLEGSNKKLFDCIKSVEPNLFQLSAIKKGTDQFSTCRQNISPILLQEIIQLQKESNELRNALLEQFERKEITEEVLLAKLTELRLNMRQQVLTIKIKHNDTLRSCLSNYLKTIKSSLSTSQWESFKNCI
jgi:hypothetical protein